MTASGLVVQSPADILDFGVIAEVLDGEQGAAGTSGEDLYVHAPQSGEAMLPELGRGWMA